MLRLSRSPRPERPLRPLAPGTRLAGDVASNALSAESDLCSRCGLCCDGSLFQYAPVEPEESDRLRRRGLPIESDGSRLRLRQPCPARGVSGCGVYTDRPASCAKFRCELLGALSRGELPMELAERRARETREAVDRLRASVGATSEPLFAAASRIARGPDTPESVGVRSELGVAAVLIRRNMQPRFPSP